MHCIENADSGFFGRAKRRPFGGTAEKICANGRDRSEISCARIIRIRSFGIEWCPLQKQGYSFVKGRSAILFVPIHIPQNILGNSPSISRIQLN